MVASASPLSACGAKTGLRVPEIQDRFDASFPDVVEPDVPTLPCVILPPDGGPVTLPLQTEQRLQQADVVFLIDTTASMGQEIEQVRARLRDVLAPAITDQIPDSQFGAAIVADFPIDPYGQPGDRAFELALPMSDDLSRVQAALNGIDLVNGRDEPEAQTEALYQLVTGVGLSIGPGSIPASAGCPRGGDGYPCFRPSALPIVLLFSDAPFHNGPNGFSPYSIRGTHTFPQALSVLQARGVRVIGFFSGINPLGREHLSAVARATGATDRAGNPLVYDIGTNGSRLGTQVIEAMRQFALGLILNVDATAVDPVPGDGIDTTRFVEAITPIAAEPADGAGPIVDNRFTRVRTGTQLVFDIRLNNRIVPQQARAQSFTVRIVFRGDGARLGAADIVIVVPGLDGSGCEVLGR